MKETYNVQGVKNIQVHKIWVPNVFNNVNEFNNKFQIQQDGQQPVSVVIPEGQYDTATLATALKTVLDANLAGGTVVTVTVKTTPLVDVDKLGFTFSGGANNGVALLYDQDDTKTYSDVDESTLSMLGFINGVAQSTTWNAPYEVNLRGYSQVYLHSKQINPGGMFDGNRGVVNVFGSVSFHDVPRGGMAYYASQDTRISTTNYPSKRNLSTINIQLKDEKGNVLDTGSSDITVILLIEY
jgi:hypothetical protein